jgi:hypothetical protein
MKNSTLSRKPSNTMRPNQGVSRSTSRVQTGDGADFAFNGQMGDGVNRMKGGISCANPMTIGDAALSMNYGLGPRRGNQNGDRRSDTRDSVPSPTAASGRIDGGRAWMPQARNNYNGNPDQINVGAGPRKGNS